MNSLREQKTKGSCAYRGHDDSGHILSGCEEIMSAIESTYNVTRTSASGECKKCQYKVYLALEEYGANYERKDGKLVSIAAYRDYHWYRQDTDSNCKPTGKWSHKPGLNKVTTGVSNPETDAQNRYYKISCGYICFPCSGLDADKK